MFTSGIHQGSVLGLALFLGFISDLPDIIEVLIILFAGDAKTYAAVSNQATVNRVLTHKCSLTLLNVITYILVTTITVRNTQ